MRSCVPLAPFFLLLLAFPCLVWAQQTTGSLEGRVLDDQAIPLGEVVVTVTSPSLLGERTATSTQDGYFRLPALPVGRYTLRLRHPVYGELVMEDVQVSLGKTTTVGALQLQGVEVMVIEGEALSDPVSTEIGANLSADLIAMLPAQRDYREVIAYLPQANTSFYGDPVNIAGSTGSENGYFVDGVNVTESFFGLESTRLPQNFVREIEVKTGGYEAEFGRSSGGIINVVTKSGGNEFQGEAFGYFSNHSFAADRRLGTFDVNHGDFARYDVGLSLGGPIARDKLWFFAAYDPTVESDDLEVPGLGLHQDKKVTHLFAGKLEWQAAERTRMTLTAFGDPTQHDRVGENTVERTVGGAGGLPTALSNIDPWLGEADTGGFSLSLNAQQLVAENTVLDLTVSRTERDDRIQPATQRGFDEPLITDLRTNVKSGGFGLRTDHHSVRRAAGLKATLYAGRHELKTGVEYEDNFLDDRWKSVTTDGQPGWLFVFADADGNVQYAQNYLDLDQVVRHRNPSAFVQDSWQATGRLRVNAGLRWDGLQIVGAAGEAVVEIYDQLQPRAGFAYQLDDAGSQKLFGSYGRFYEQIPTVTSSAAFGNYEQFLKYYAEDPRENPDAEPVATLVLADGSDPTKVDGIDGPHHDEFVLGYERRMKETWKVQIRGIYRNLREAFEDAIVTDGTTIELVWGNPGRGELSHIPRPKRQYAGLELGVQKTLTGRYQVGLSYVLSRTHGNYPGAFPTDEFGFPHRSSAFDISQRFDEEGPLPNDRPHVFKMYGTYATSYGLTMGGFFTWQNGAPRTANGRTRVGLLPTRMLVGDRGGLGRTPAIWDLNLRFAYDLQNLGIGGSSSRSRLLLDVFHLFGQRKAVVFDDLQYSSVEYETGEPGNANPTFNEVIAYQPPMTLRLGIETTF